MTVLHERITTSLPIERVFGFIADFANAAQWDPGTVLSAPLDPGPVSVGSRYRLHVRAGGLVVPMEYVVTAYDPPNRVVLRGSGRGIRAVDEIRFAADDGGTAIDYTADIRLVGLLRPAGRFADGALEGIGRAAREGMDQALRRQAVGA